MRKRAVLCAILAALILAGSFAQVALGRSDLGGEESRAGEGASASVNYLDFLGGVRQFLAYVLWIRTESLHHGYYESLSSESELIPYYKLISYLDPHYIDAYYVGGATIFYAGSEQEAIDFTLEGIANNPDNGDLYASLADLYMRQEKYQQAREAYREAIGKRLEFVDMMYLTAGIAVTSNALGDPAGAIAALREQLDYYRLALMREGLDQAARKFVVTKINLLEGRISELRKTIAEPVSGEEDQAGD